VRVHDLDRDVLREPRGTAALGEEQGRHSALSQLADDAEFSYSVTRLEHALHPPPGTSRAGVREA
jgi:hypothetical protein